MERFIEMPVIGTMLLLPILPLLAAKYGSATVYRELGTALSTPVRAGLLLGLVFVAGVVGNQLVDELFHVESVKNLMKFDFDRGKSKNKCPDPKKPDEVVVEFAIAGKNEYARAYFERHRLFTRIDRAGLVSMLLLFFTLLLYRRHIGDKKPTYVEALVFALAIAFGAAYVTEEEAIDDRVKELRALYRSEAEHGGESVYRLQR